MTVSPSAPTGTIIFAALVTAVCGGPSPDAKRAVRPEAVGVTLTPFRARPGRRPITVDVASASVSSAGPTALDGLTRGQVADFRRRKVGEQSELGLFPEDYDPFTGPGQRIYASITPGVRWLGPTAFYVANPYLLVILTCANHVTPLGLFCPGFRITYDNGRIEELHNGQAARCWLDRVYERPYAEYPGQLRVNMVNASDAGFRWAHVDLAASENVLAGDGRANIARMAYSQSSFYHVGRYGANNISPEDRNGWIRLKKSQVRTVVTVKLWRQQPATERAPAQITYLVIVNPADR